ncbi:putative cyclin 11, partial [Trypanosoma cruzi]
MPIEQVILTIHAIYDLPREMQQLDPRREQLELFVQPVVNYNYRGRRVKLLPLGESVMPFSSSSILFKRERFILDLGNVTTPYASPKCTLPSISPRTSPWRRWYPTAGGETNEEDDSDNETSNNDTKRNMIHGNQVLLQYPCTLGLSTTLDVMVGVRQHRIGSFVLRCITVGQSADTHSDGAGFFSVAIEEVRKKKTVTRVVGLSVGGVILSVSVNPNDDKESVLGRLIGDKNRNLASCGNNQALEKLDVAAMLLEGFSEVEIYQHMRLIVDPDYYLRRLENLIALYPAQGSEEWRQSGVLLQKYASREEELMRRANLEIGPECSSVSARHRLLAYRYKYHLSDQSVRECLQSVLGEEIHETLVTEPEVVFEL